MSMDFAEAQANLINEIIESDIDLSTFSFLDPMHQQRKMEQAASGKSAISIYANYVTFNSLSQQLDKKMQVREYVINESGKIKK